MPESGFRGNRLGLAFGLLSASVVTVIGVVRNLDPEVILLRTFLAGLGCGIMALVTVAILKRLGSNVE